MLQADLKKLLDETGLPVVYSHWIRGKAPALPYIVFWRTDSQTTGSDHGCELRHDTYDIELYSSQKSPADEAKLESVLDAAGIQYECYEEYLDTEDMYQVVYSIEFYYRR